MFEGLYTLLARCIVLVAIIPLHECAHGLVANRLGDPTAKNQGRLTLNPIKHFDPIGSVLMLLTGFGWAKAVPVNPRYFKKPKTGMAVTALAGPLSNLIFGFILLIVYRLVYGLFAPAAAAASAPVQALFLGVTEILWAMFSINISLAVFNLLPVPPLDGSRIVSILLPDKVYFTVMQYERYIFLVMAVLLYLGVFSTPLGYGVQFVVRLMVKMTGFVDVFTGLFV
ncbi:MAG: site-2 protease family protein [Oscillospiraceae bacterium]|mgnify:CR=1 FL=1|jgi:Zn-dependent protease|nr:site-2 protease family protein [Oscillospiraceae bacterium]